MNLDEFNDSLKANEEWLIGLINYYNGISRFPLIRNNNCKDVLSVLYLECVEKDLYVNIKDNEHFRKVMTLVLKNIFTRRNGKYVYDLIYKTNVRDIVYTDDLSYIENNDSNIDYTNNYIYNINGVDIEDQYNALDEWLKDSFNRKFYVIFMKDFNIARTSRDLKISTFSVWKMVEKMKREIYYLATTDKTYEEIKLLVKEEESIRRKKKNNKKNKNER